MTEADKYGKWERAVLESRRPDLLLPLIGVTGPAVFVIIRVLFFQGVLLAEL